jgi:hypothetical protein
MRSTANAGRSTLVSSRFRETLTYGKVHLEAISHFQWSLESSAGSRTGIPELLLRANRDEHFAGTDEAIRGFKLTQGACNFLPD